MPVTSMKPLVSVRIQVEWSAFSLWPQAEDALKAKTGAPVHKIALDGLALHGTCNLVAQDATRRALHAVDPAGTHLLRICTHGSLSLSCMMMAAAACKEQQWKHLHCHLVARW